MSNFYILDLVNVATAIHRCIGVVNKSRWRSACGLHLRRSIASWLNAQVYYTLVDCNPLTPLLRFVPDLSYKLFLHCYAAVGKIFYWHIASRGSSAVAELLVNTDISHPRDVSILHNTLWLETKWRKVQSRSWSVTVYIILDVNLLSICSLFVYRWLGCTNLNVDAVLL